MFEHASQRFWSYMDFYQTYAANRWNHLQPMEYGVLLISIGVFGWLLMKNAAHR